MPKDDAGIIAHIRKLDHQQQSLEDHLLNVAELARKNAEKLRLGDVGKLLGLLHDVGKYSSAFQAYIKSAEGLIDQDSDDYIDASQQKGKIDHSTAGSQLAWEMEFDSQDLSRQLLAQMLALVLASHHSGLIDCLAPDGVDSFSRRMEKADEKTHLSEVKSKISPEIMRRVRELFEDKDLPFKFQARIAEIVRGEEKFPVNVKCRLHFKLGLFLRMLFSCLIDADRTDTVDFEKYGAAQIRQKGHYTEWSILAKRLEEYLTHFSSEGTINQGRKKISDDCKNAAAREKGVFTLTAPTGGGKTLASLRFALQHALEYQDTPQKIERIFYILPYTTIIDQNAQLAREILEPPEERGCVVLECHSNLTKERETWTGKLLSENWDAPVVFTTNVQFLEALFGGGTRSVRRMHQLANSIIIFDEIQTLPVCMVHLFCNALNFLVEQCGTSVVLCTATQPLLNGVDKKLGSMFYTSDNEILSDIPSVFKTFHRVEIVDRLKPGGYAKEEISALILEEQQSFGTCLAVVNTTRAARDIYILVKESFQNTVHLSANMCPAHRMEVLENVREHLKRVPQKPLICVSTQVIEAGVDVDFGAGIRCLAGVDSIAQTTGRCNRHGNREYGRISIVNLRDENIDKLADIAKGQEVTRSVLRAIQNDPSLAGADLLSPEVIERYFRHYFYDRAEEMSYNVKKPRNDTLLNMLADNIYAVNEHNKLKPKFFPFLRQSFASAAEQFKAIDAPTRGVIVPYKEGKSIIAQLCGQIFDPSKIAALLHRAQLYSVNVYANVFDILQKQGVIYEITVDSDRTDLGVWALRGEYYSVDFGLSREPVAKFEVAQA